MLQLVVTELRACDLFTVADTYAALDGATAAVVSAPSLVPPAALLQASRRATQLLALDTVVRAARARGIAVHARPSATDAWLEELVPTPPPPGGRAVRLVWPRAGARVVSIQEMAARPGSTAARALASYLELLPRLLRGAIAVHDDGARVAFAVPHGPPLLAFRRDADGDPRSASLAVTGGLLGRAGGGTFEFRVVRLGSGEERLLTAVHGFTPRLPFALYARTQARAHRVVMAAFARAWEERGGVFGSERR